MSGWFKDRLPELDDEVEQTQQLTTAGAAGNPFANAVFDEGFQEVSIIEDEDSGELNFTSTGRAVPDAFVVDEADADKIEVIELIKPVDERE